MTTQTIECSKCGGKGYIAGLGHYANGVCFGCNGQKKITVNLSNLQNKLDADTRKKAEWILASTEASYANLSFAKLSKIRNFAHGGWGIDKAYPEMLNHYFAVGEPAFQRAQAARLA